MMMAPEYYVFTGRDGEVIPWHMNITHVLIDKALKFVAARAFYNHPDIEEVICHDGVEKIEQYAFYHCRSLRRVIMPGVKIIEKHAFRICKALTYIECGKLEKIGEWAFLSCKSLSSIDLPSAKIVEIEALEDCTSLTIAKFGNEIESIRERVFYNCPSLERIALPLKDGIITSDNTFQRCVKLNHVDLIGGVKETIDAFLMEEWKNDMKDEIDAINRILPNTPAGTNFYEEGGKAQAIRAWIRPVLLKIIHYKAEHCRYLNVAVATLQPALPNDIVQKNVLAFLELPSYTFEGEN